MTYAEPPTMPDSTGARMDDAGLEAENARLRGALEEIARGDVPPEREGHYLAHRSAVRVARAAIRRGAE